MNDELSKYVSFNFINQIPGLFTIVDSNSKLLAANSTSLDWWGYDRADDIIGLSYGDFPCKISELHNLLVAQDKTVLSMNKPSRIIGRFCYAKDNWKVLLGQKYLIKNEQDEVMGVVAHFDEITDYPIFDFLNLFGVFDKNQCKFNLNQQISYYIEDSYPEIALSERESECLFFVLRGKVTKEIAQILKISPRTVEAYFDNIKTKLMCANKSQVIEKAIALGYMHIVPKKLIL